MQSIRDADFLECEEHILLDGQEEGNALALAARCGSKQGLSDENPAQCTLSLFARLCCQIQSHPFHSHPDHEGSESAVAEQAASQSPPGALVFVVAVHSTWQKSTDHKDAWTCLKLLRSLASGGPGHYDPCLFLCRLLTTSSGGAVSYFLATKCRKS